MQAEAAVEKILHLIDYDGNKVGIIRWHHQQGLSSQAIAPTDQLELDALTARLSTSRLHINV